MHPAIRAAFGALAFALATFGVAEAEEEAAQPSAAVDQLPEDQGVSDAVVDVARWIVATGDNNGRPFAIIDKGAAQIFVFSADGRVRGAAPGLFGSAIGDHIAAGVAGLALRDIPDEDRTTPAGRFLGGFGPSIGGGRVLWVDYDSAVSIHPLSGAAAERRAERLASPSPDDNRITHGCINVSREFFQEVIRPTFAKGGVFYVLPDAASLAETFPGFERTGRRFQGFARSGESFQRFARRVGEYLGFTRNDEASQVDDASRARRSRQWGRNRVVPLASKTGL